MPAARRLRMVVGEGSAGKNKACGSDAAHACRGKGRIAHLGLTPIDGSAILHGIHPSPLGLEGLGVAADS
jgi:hypothetical protein